MDIITVHGIRRQHNWYEHFAELDAIKAGDITVHHFDYGYFTFGKFLRKSCRDEIVGEFCRYYSEKFKDSKKPPSVIAHSFGTYVVYQAMKKYSDIKFDKIVFCGSILTAKLDFRPLLLKKQFKKLKNDHGTLEWFLKYTSKLTSDCGNAGEIGFQDIPPAHAKNIINESSYKSHSEYFLPLHMQKNWVPFVLQDYNVYKFDNNILKHIVIERIYENQPKLSIFDVHELKVYARFDIAGNYFAKYEKHGINNKEGAVLDSLDFITTADGIHDASKMNFVAYDHANRKLPVEVTKDINHHKTFHISFLTPIKYREAATIKHYFSWYNTINLNGDTDHWNISGIRYIYLSLNFPNDLKKPKVFVIRNKKVIAQELLALKVEKDGTSSYTLTYENTDSSDGLIFYFEGLRDATHGSQKRHKDTEFSLKGRKDRYAITKASSTDIKQVYKIEAEIEHSNAATEETLSQRRIMFNDGFLVVKKREKVVGYLESFIWNEKQFSKFEDISNFPLHYNVNGDTFYIIFLAVDKAFRRRGIAKRLLSEIENVAKDYGVKRVRLVAKDGLVEMYSKVGYRELQNLPNFLPKKEYTSILMEKLL